MMQPELLCKLVGRAIGVDETLVTMDTNSSDFPEWDSLGHINVLMALQEHFGDNYQEDPSLASAVSVKDIYEVLHK